MLHAILRNRFTDLEKKTARVIMNALYPSRRKHSYVITPAVTFTMHLHVLVVARVNCLLRFCSPNDP